MSLFEYINKIRFKSPKQADVLIFDAEGSDFLTQHVLNGIDYCILHSRQEIFYCSPKIILYIIFNINIINLVKLKKVVSEFYKAYLLACFHCIKPKVVLTVIDNEPMFHWLSRTYTNASFYAIQNRVTIINDKWEYTDSDLKKLLVFGGDGRANCVTNFICFGKKEEFFYRKYGAKIDNYFPVGSLKGSYYKYVLNRDPLEKKYTLCLVSQFRKIIFEGEEYHNFKKSMLTMETFLKRFVEETGVSLCIATAKDSIDEYEHFQRTFGDSATSIIKNNRSAFSTYRAMEESQVIISNYSAAAIEAFGWGKKMLLCNFSGDPLYSFTILDICMIDIADYNIFKEKLQNLIDMDSENFLRETLDKQKYVMNYDPDVPVNEYVRKIVLKHIM